METYTSVGSNANAEMDPHQQEVEVVQVQPAPVGRAPLLYLNMGSRLPHASFMDRWDNLPQPPYTHAAGRVMTDEQLEVLRRQISVYATICDQLLEMHKARVSAPSAPAAGMVVGRHTAYDPLAGTPNHRTTARQRWTPSQIQLQILEKLFDEGNGTPQKTRLKEITAELSQHGQITESNVYNWFQNRKARVKRKQQVVSTEDGESEVDKDNETAKEKKKKEDSGQESSNCGGPSETGTNHSSDEGGMFDQEPTVVEHYDQQENTSSHLQV